MIQLSLDEKLLPQGPPPYTVEVSGQENSEVAGGYPPAPQPSLLYPASGLSPTGSFTNQGQPVNLPNRRPTQMPMQPTSQSQLADEQLGSRYQQQLFARCARGDHAVVTKHGPCGIISSIILFPIGLIFLFIDVEKRCERCGEQLPR